MSEVPRSTGGLLASVSRETLADLKGVSNGSVTAVRAVLLTGASISESMSAERVVRWRRDVPTALATAPIADTFG